MIRLRLLGSIELQDDTGHELRAVLAQPKRLAILGYLAAASPLGPHRRDTLLGLFWPDLDQEHARNALSKAVQFLRRALGDAAIASRTPDELSLNPAEIWVDVRAYSHALETDRLEEALELYRGDLLPSFFVSGATGFEEWLERERAALRGQAAAAARILAERHELGRHPTLAVACAHRAAELGNGDERPIRRLIELLDRLGDRAGAVRAYEDFVRKLASELEVEPSPETAALIARVRTSSERCLAPNSVSVPPNSSQPTIARLTAALAHRYKIERELGAGAMAVVFLAHDSRHHRRVAIKVLRPELTPCMGVDRFLREIDIAADLMHPHILPVHDSGEADGLLYYVMPYVEGESLRGRLQREHRLQLEDVLQIGIEVADALSHAHHRGFVHRDIKPENILLGGGHALVTDFGIARAIGAIGNYPSVRGLGSGTPAYMSPEQASGADPIDGRTDVYALGCVMYEMLSGRQSFVEDRVDDTASQRLFPSPHRLTDLLEAVSPALETAISKAMARAPADRFSGVAEFAAVLRQEAGLAVLNRSTTADLILPGGSNRGGASEVSIPEKEPKPRKARRSHDKRRLAGSLLVVAPVVALGLFWLGTAREARPGGLGTAVQITFEPGLEIEPTLSPDGRFVAYSAPTPAGTLIYLRQAGGRALPIAPNAEPTQRRPLWSPDGTRILFLQGPDLAAVPVLGGMPTTIVRAGRGRAAVDAAPVGWRDGVVAAAWAPDGGQVAYVIGDSVYVKSLDGGTPRPVAARADIHSLAWGPDGRRIALATGNVQYEGGEIAMLGNGGVSEILIVRADAAAPPVAVTGRASLNTSPAWTPDGKHLLFISDRHGPRDVYLIRVDASGRPRGEPTRVTTGLNPHTIALSAGGERLAYSAFTIKSNVWSVPLSPTGPAAASQAVPVTTGTQYIEGLVLSRDLKRVYFASNQRGNFDIYRVDLPAGEPVQITTDPADEWEADESPDGRWLTFYSLRHGTRDIFVMPTQGGTAERVTSDPGEERYPHWSPDGSTVSFTTDDSPAANGTFIVSRGPGGRWSAPRQVSPHVGQSVWSADGKSILRVVNDRIAAVPLDGRSPRQLYAVRSGSPDPTPTFVFGRLPNLGGFIPFNAWGPDGESFWGLPERGGRPRLLARANDLTNVNSGTGMRGVNTDGARLYFTMDDRESDIFVVEVRR
ncbi:MAG TPA: protein kinase [Gemmatimonadales bacterium]|nr:protein kinase [Gemmatimonadales bacterium]